jgi:MoxR-like ATPase
VAKSHAVIEGRDYVTPGDVKAVAEDVLSHRVILAPEARTAGIDAADSIREALERTAIPV